MHFTLSLVDLAVFELPREMGGYLVQPRILALTRMIDRGIVTVENGTLMIKPPLDQDKGVVRGTTISEEKFYEELAVNFPMVGPRLKAFTERLDAIDVGIDFGKKSMILRFSSPREQVEHAGAFGFIGPLQPAGPAKDPCVRVE